MLNIFRPITVVLFIVIISGCQSTQTTSRTNSNLFYEPEIFVDDAFGEYQSVSVESLEEVFELSHEMEQQIVHKLLIERNHEKRAKKLIRILFLEKDSEIDYRYGANLTAKQAYLSKEANCMSLTIMAYALAEAAELDAVFQDVQVPEYWIRNGEHSLLTGHVNISIKLPREPNIALVWGSETLEIDFDPLVAKKSFPKKRITKNTILAMFYNNKGAQYLVDGDFDSAYAYFKSAIDSDPFFVSTWGNLGILYRLKGLYKHAEIAYKYATDLDGDNLTALTNYALLLKVKGNVVKAELIEKAIHEKRLSNPYYHALLADEAHYAGNNRKAIIHYRKAIKLNKKIHEFYFGLAKVYFDMNEIASAKSHLKKAIRLSKRSSVNRKYEAKLAVLNAHNW